MKTKIADFIIDVVRTFMHFAYSGVLVIAHLLYHIIQVIHTFIQKVIIPQAIDVLTFLGHITVVLSMEMLLFTSFLALQSIKVLFKLVISCQEGVAYIQDRYKWI